VIAVLDVAYSRTYDSVIGSLPRGNENLKTTLIATCIGTAVGLGAWVFGIGGVIWPAHPQIASFLLTLASTIVIQITWPKVTETNSR